MMDDGFSALGSIPSRATAVEVVAAVISFIDDRTAYVTNSDSVVDGALTVDFKQTLLLLAHEAIRFHRITREEILEVYMRDDHGDDMAELEEMLPQGRA